MNDEPPSFNAAASGPWCAGTQSSATAWRRQPGARFQNARDLVFHLETVSHTTGATPALAPRRRVSKSEHARSIVIRPSRRPDRGGAGYLAWRRYAPAPRIAGCSQRPPRDGLPRSRGVAIDLAGPEVRAFTANVNGRRQIFVRLLAGGPPLQITKDAVDHQFPRWSPDAELAPVLLAGRARRRAGRRSGAFPRLGGAPRRVIGSIGGADVSSDGRMTCFSLVDGQIQLLTSALDGSDVRAIARFRCRLSPLSALVSGQPLDCVPTRRRRAIRHLRRLGAWR